VLNLDESGLKLQVCLSILISLISELTVPLSIWFCQRENDTVFTMLNRISSPEWFLIKFLKGKVYG